MATRKPRATDSPPADQWAMPVGQLAALPAPDVDEFEEEQTPADRIVETLSGVRDDDRAYVKVNRVSGGKVSWCMDYEPDVFEAGGLKLIREQWGPGTYQLLVYGSVPGTKRFAIRTRATVEIETPKTALPTLGAAPPSSDLANLFATLAEGQRAMLEALTKRPDPMESMTAQLSMMKLMREAFGGGDARPPTPMSELLVAMKEMRAASRMFEGKDEEDEGGMMGVLKQLGPLISQTMGAAKASPPPQLALPPSIAHAAPELPDAANTTPDQDDPEMLKEAAAAIKLHGLLRTLIHYDNATGPGGKYPEAERETERALAVGNCAELLFDKLPDDMLDMMELPVWFDLLCDQAPDARAHETFIRAVHARLTEIIAEEAHHEAGDTEAGVYVDEPPKVAPGPPRLEAVSPPKPGPKKRA